MAEIEEEEGVFVNGIGWTEKDPRPAGSPFVGARVPSGRVPLRRVIGAAVELSGLSHIIWQHDEVGADMAAWRCAAVQAARELTGFNATVIGHLVRRRGDIVMQWAAKADAAKVQQVVALVRRKAGT